MNPPDPAQIARARRLVALEAAAASADGRATPAAHRVYDRIHAQMAPLVGDAASHLLFLRSAKLAQGEFAPLAEISSLERSEKLRELLHSRDPGLSMESVVTLLGTYFTLVSTFIGERLLTQVLRRVWPAIDDAAPKETEQ